MECGHQESSWLTDADGNEYCSECLPDPPTLETQFIPKRPPANRSTKAMFLRFDPIIDAKIRALSIKRQCTLAEVIEAKFRDDE